MKKGLPLLLASAGFLLYRKVKEQKPASTSFPALFSGITVESDATALRLIARTEMTGVLAVTVEGTAYRKSWRGAAEKERLVAELPAAPPGAYTFSIARLRAGNTLVSKKDVIRGTFTLDNEGNRQGNPE
jgi:hypothetical protein